MLPSVLARIFVSYQLQPLERLTIGTICGARVWPSSLAPTFGVPKAGLKSASFGEGSQLLFEKEIL